MADSLIQSIVGALSCIPKELVAFLISIVPILELRGGLVAASILGVDWRLAFPLCVIGNVLPVPFILLFIDKIFSFIKKTKFHKLAEFFEKKANGKSVGSVCLCCSSASRHRRMDGCIDSIAA